MQGWVSIHRQLKDHWLWEDKPFSYGQAWIDMLLMANHKEAKVPLGNEVITVERGSFITSEIKLMDKWGWSKTKVRRFLELLENDSMLIKKTDRKKTTLTICNYSCYQVSETDKEPKKNQKKTNKRPIKDTNNNDNTEFNENKKQIYITCQHLSMTEIEYTKLIDLYGKKVVDSKLEYCDNYANLKKYSSLYKTVNNWIKSDIEKQQDKPKVYKKERID